MNKDTNVLLKKFELSLNSFISKVKKDKNVVAIIVFGSFSKQDYWEKSDIDLMILVKDNCLKNNNLVYSALNEKIDYEISINKRSDFINRLYNINTLCFYRNIIKTGKLLFCIDEEIEELFSNPLELLKKEKTTQLLISADYACICRLKAEKCLYCERNIRKSLDYINRYYSNLACIEILLNNDIYGRDIFEKAIKYNNEMFIDIYDNIYKKEITIAIIEKLYLKAEKYFKNHLSMIYKPLLEWLKKEDGERSISEINNYLYNTYGINNDLFQLTNACNLLKEEGYLIETSLTRTLYSNSKTYIEEQAYTYNSEKEE